MALNILLIEDVVSMRIFIKNSLPEYFFLFASDGLEAKNLVTTRPDISLILLDLRLPDMDGIEVLKFIRERNKDIPIIVITGYPTKENIIKCTNLGIQGLFTKPFKIEELKQKIDSILKEPKS